MYVHYIHPYILTIWPVKKVLALVWGVNLGRNPTGLTYLGDPSLGSILAWYAGHPLGDQHHHLVPVSPSLPHTTGPLPTSDQRHLTGALPGSTGLGMHGHGSWHVSPRPLTCKSVKWARCMAVVQKHKIRGLVTKHGN